MRRRVQPLERLPDLNFNCLIIYRTSKGYRRQARVKTRAMAADLAVEVAERLVRKDKRRDVNRVVYSQAIQA